MHHLRSAGAKPRSQPAWVQVIVPLLSIAWLNPAHNFNGRPFRKTCLEARRRLTDVNMRAGRGTGNRAAKRDKWNSSLTQVIEHRLTFSALGMKRHVNRVMMIEPHPVMSS